MQFAGFTQSDFDAYQPSRASSNAFNRPRLEVKQKALGLARALAELARNAGTSLEARASDEHPSLWNKRSVTAQWAFLWRDDAARRQLEQLLSQGKNLAATLTDPTPYFRHAFLAICLDAERIETAFKVHGDAWVDARNLRALLADDVGVAGLLSVIQALPSDYVCGVTGKTPLRASEVTVEALRASVDALGDPNAWWFVGRSLSSAEAIALGPALGEFIRAAFEALLPVYRLVAWSESNDRVRVRDELEEAHATRSAHVTENAAREAAWRAEQDSAAALRREAAIAASRERRASLEPARPAAVHAAVQSVVHLPPPSAPPSPRPAAPKPAAESKSAAESKPAPVKPQVKPQEVKTPEVKPQEVKPSAARPLTPPREPSVPRPSAVMIEGGPVSLGARVRVRTGPFKDKVGTITDLDPRGGIKVAFGLLSARLEAGDVVRVVE